MCVRHVLRVSALLLTTTLAWALPFASVETPYDLYYIGDMDPAGTGSLAEGIEVTLGIVDANEHYDRLTIDLQLTYAGQNLASGHFWATNVNGGWSASYSVAEFRNGIELPAAANVDSYDSSGDYNEDFIENVSGNLLPAGTYTVSVRFGDENGLLGSPVSVSFTVNDQRNLQLQLPWTDAVIGTEQPAFAWSGRAPQYRVRVCEYNGERHSSPLEAIEEMPVWEAVVEQPSAVYGLQGQQRSPLVDGGDYAWVVYSVLNTTSGEQEFPSEVRVFHYRSGEGNQPLEDLLGGLNPSQLAGLGDLMQQLSLNGAITVDGQVVSPQELQELVQRLASGELHVAGIRME